MRTFACTAVLIATAITALPTYIQAQESSAQDEQNGCGTRGVRVLRPEACPKAPPRILQIQPAPQPARTLPSPLPDPPPIVSCTRAFVSANLNVGAPGFDGDLNRILVVQAESVVVDPVEPFAAADPPKAVAGWLAEVQRTGGQVSRKAISCGDRGFSLFKTLKQFFAPRVSVYTPAKDYNAVLWLEPESGLVTQVQFTRRAAGG